MSSSNKNLAFYKAVKNWDEAFARECIMKALVFLAPLADFDSSKICDEIIKTIRERRESILALDKSRYTLNLSIDEYCVVKCLPYLIKRDQESLIMRLFCIPERSIKTLKRNYIPRDFYAYLCQLDASPANIQQIIGFNNGVTAAAEYRANFLGYSYPNYYAHSEAYLYYLAHQNSSGAKLETLKLFSKLSEGQLNTIAGRCTELHGSKRGEAYERFKTAFENGDTSSEITRLEANLIRRYFSLLKDSVQEERDAMLDSLSKVLRLDKRLLITIAKDENWVFYNYRNDFSESTYDQIFPPYGKPAIESHFALAETIAETFSDIEKLGKIYGAEKNAGITNGSWYVFARVFYDKIVALSKSAV